MMDITDLEWSYNVVNTKGVFIGLNNRAVSFMIENGDWMKIEDPYDYGYEGDYGLLFVSNDSEKYNFCNLIGSLYREYIIPTFVHDWFPYNKSDNPDEVKFMPLYRYKMNNNKVSDIWLYEAVDNQKSELYKDIKVMCLVDKDGNRLFEWTSDELEIAELMVEYHLGL